MVGFDLDAQGLDDAGDRFVLADDHDEFHGPRLPEFGFQRAEQFVRHRHLMDRLGGGKDKPLGRGEHGRFTPGRQRGRLVRADPGVQGHRAVVTPLVGRADELRQPQYRQLAQPWRAALPAAQRLRQRPVRHHQSRGISQRPEDVRRIAALVLEGVEDPAQPRRLIVVLNQRNSCHASSLTPGGRACRRQTVCQHWSQAAEHGKGS
nr:hypothetical protein [Trebonia sp.]